MIFNWDSGILPSICMMDPIARKDIKQPIVGLSLLTLCFSPQSRIFFYLCHVCEEKCPPDKIANHLSSGDHCSNYFSYTDPNVLSFSWIPGKGVGVSLRPALLKEVRKRGKGQLQMLDLPEKLLKKLEPSVYSEVMCALSENDKLLKLLDAVKPKRTMIQTYQTDSNRKHPLLGMQHLVECVCVEPTEKTHYLCTLCNLTLGAHMIIKHVLSFDHIFCYFRAWHPSTLLAKECYKNYTVPFVSVMLDFTKQTEEIHGTANAAVKQVRLEPAQFASVNFTCYAEALKRLESIAKENESSLITSVKPGNKLEYRSVSAECAVLSLKIHCQNCCRSFGSVDLYFQHVPSWKHKKMLDSVFGQDKRGGYDQTGWTPNLGLFWCLKESLRENQPVIGELTHMWFFC
ncbi:uncharacterized protein [Pempheris klunzingeri]|uniref:uncharacterized protein n=1 Tax=Pempheris klunzingeri TaxID=3127111 RepID=UPI00397ED494